MRLSDHELDHIHSQDKKGHRIATESDVHTPEFEDKKGVRKWLSNKFLHNNV